MSRAELFRRLSRRLYPEPERRSGIVHTHLFGPDAWSSAARRCITRCIDSWMRREPKFVSTAHNVDRDDSSLRRAAAEPRGAWIA